MPSLAPSHLKIRLSALFFIQCHAQAFWYVPFSNVLRAHGLDWLIPYAFACSAVAALVSPLIGGALADEHIPAERLLGWLSLTVGVLLGLVFLAVQQRWGGGWVVVLLLLQQFAFAPIGSLLVATIMGSLRHPEREYGPIRVWGTYGWMLAGPLLSYVLHADTSTLSGFLGAAGYLALAAFTLTLPGTPPNRAAAPKRWRDLVGRDTLNLLRDSDVRTVFFTAALFSVPLAAFYPFAPLSLRDAGGDNPAAAMSLGQVTEILATYALAPLLLRWRLKWILLSGLSFGVLRYVLFAGNTKLLILSGISLHGCCYTLFFVTSQIYLERKIPLRYRSRAQALLTVMILGVGNLFGYLGSGWLRTWCSDTTGTHWTQYWTILAISTLAVLVYFALRFRGEFVAQPAEQTVAAVPVGSPAPE
jgi:MFS family permease